MGLDRNAPLPLEVHRIQQLILLVSVGDRTGGLQQPVRKRRLPVIDVSDNAKVPSQKSSHAEGELYRRQTQNPGRKRRKVRSDWGLVIGERQLTTQGHRVSLSAATETDFSGVDTHWSCKRGMQRPSDSASR